MTEVEIAPGPVSGRLEAPPSKSYTHRALVAGFLTGRPYRIRNPSRCADTRATRNGLGAFGTAVEEAAGEWRLLPGPEPPPPSGRRIACGSSGTTLRLLTALAALSGSHRRSFSGSPGLARRPIRGLLEPLARHGAEIRGPPPGRGLPFSVKGPIAPGRYDVDGSSSSQFLSALLLTLPVLAGRSELRPTGSTVSRPYLEATRAVLAAHGVPVRRAGEGFRLPGGARYLGDRFVVPGDSSSAAYLWSAGALAGGPVTVTGIDPAWPQADRAILAVLGRMGARVHRRGAAATVSGPLTGPVAFDATGAPDLAGLVAVLAAVAPTGPSRLTGTARLAEKESDRRQGAADLARAFGARVRAGPDSLEIRPGPLPERLRLLAPDDHRTVMSAAVGMLALRGTSRLAPGEAVRKSYPGFWSAIATLGATVRWNR